MPHSLVSPIAALEPRHDVLLDLQVITMRALGTSGYLGVHEQADLATMIRACRFVAGGYQAVHYASAYAQAAQSFLPHTAGWR